MSILRPHDSPAKRFSSPIRVTQRNEHGTILAPAPHARRRRLAGLAGHVIRGAAAFFTTGPGPALARVRTIRVTRRGHSFPRCRARICGSFSPALVTSRAGCCGPSSIPLATTADSLAEQGSSLLSPLLLLLLLYLRSRTSSRSKINVGHVMSDDADLLRLAARRCHVLLHTRTYQ